jgi:hypothetical protein
MPLKKEAYDTIVRVLQTHATIDTTFLKGYLLKKQKVVNTLPAELLPNLQPLYPPHRPGIFRKKTCWLIKNL